MKLELLIGREYNSSNLVLSDTKQTVRLTNDNSVPQTVSRLKPDVPTAHCCLLIDDISIKIKNLNPKNITYVDGHAVPQSCDLKPDSVVELGPDHYPLDLGKILKQLKYQPTYPVGHLKGVWHEYDQELLRLQLEQQKQQNQQRLMSVLSQVGMVCMIVPMCIPSLDIPTWVRAVVSLAAVGMGIFFYIRGSRVNNSFVMKKRKLDSEFKKVYLCPNPSCRAFFGFVDYDTNILPKTKCPNCGCKLSH